MTREVQAGFSPLFVIMQREMVLILDDNLFFSSSVSAQLSRAGLSPRLIIPREIASYLNSTVSLSIVILNLNSKSWVPLEIVRQLKKSGSAKILGFCGHGQTLLMQQAKEAGCDWVIPNSVVAKRLIHFLRQQKLLASSGDKPEQNS